MVHIKGYIGNEEGEISLLSLVEQVQKEKGDTIHVLIDSLGGDLDVGFAMYDYLMSLDKIVVTECVNNCASAATLPFIAGAKRIAGCPIMIHNPYLTGVSGDGELLRAAADYVEEKEKQAEKIYAEHTNVDAQVLSELMKSDTYMSPNQAASLGFATEAKQVVLAKIDNSNINKKKTKMSKPEKGLGQKLKELLTGKTQARGEDPVVYNMDLETADGSILYVDREEGAPQVGDTATPDGTFTMPDGSVITVADGVITDITGVENAEEAEITEEEVNEVVETIEELVQERDELLEKVEEQEKELVQARKVMNAVKMAGGYDKVFGKFKTSYRPQARSGQRDNKQEVQQKNALRDRIEAMQEKGGKK